ncbi:TIMELESS-interacting protein [Bacillus rossius redtenbacheri]|uniref:TIMELESS-interacting protein n=1 Tax=Bacillus rossius redtenbacheri TaxID=93214 RepID=UPI002FDDA261
MFDDEAAVDLGRDTDDLEILIEGGLDSDRVNEDDPDEIQDEAEGNQPNPESTPVQPKKRVVKRPQPKLDPERLRGPRGIATLEHVFKDFKFHGKGQEKHDLDRMMKQLEHWAHRLFPRFQFDECLEKLEKLGHKKPVGTLVKRIRMGLETDDELVERGGKEGEDGSDAGDRLADLGAGADESPLDAFDALLSQQLSEARARTPMPPPRPPQTPQVLSEEQRERMLRNRQLAEERRLAKLRAQQDKSAQQEREAGPSRGQCREVDGNEERRSDEVGEQGTGDAADCRRLETSPPHSPRPDADEGGAGNVTGDMFTTRDDCNASKDNVTSELAMNE